MEFEQLKERRRFLSEQHYKNQKAAEQAAETSHKRRAARCTQWENHKSKKKKFSGMRNWASYKLSFYKLLPEGESEQEEILARLIGSFPACGITSTDQRMHVQCDTTLYRKFTQIHEFLSEKVSDDVANMLLLLWGKNLAEYDYLMFVARGLQFVNDDDVPLRCVAQMKAEKCRQGLFKNNHREDMRRLNMEYGISVYKEIRNQHRQSGQIIDVLCKVLPSTRYFAKRIITMTEAGREGELLVRERRRDSMPKEAKEEFIEFLTQPSISRAVPGRDISVSYGNRQPLNLLRHSKEAIVEMFKRTQPHNWSVRKLLMCFPRNFRIPRDNDRSRNACPIHDSFPR